MGIGWRVLSSVAAAGALTGAVMTAPAAAEPAATSPGLAMAYECGLNTWTTWEPYFGYLQHYLYKNCEAQTVNRKLHSLSNPGYPYQCYVIGAGAEQSMGYVSASGFPPESAVAC